MTTVSSHYRGRCRRSPSRRAATWRSAAPLEILRWAADTFGAGFCVTSSMEDAVVAHLASRGVARAWTWSSSTPATTSRRPSAPGTRSRP